MSENLSEMSIWGAKDKNMMPLSLAGVQLFGALSYTRKGSWFNPRAHNWAAVRAQLGPLWEGNPLLLSLSPISKHALR